MLNEARRDNFMSLVLKNRSIVWLITHYFSLKSQSMSSKWKCNHCNCFTLHKNCNCIVSGLLLQAFGYWSSGINGFWFHFYTYFSINEPYFERKISVYKKVVCLHSYHTHNHVDYRVVNCFQLHKIIFSFICLLSVE